MVSRRVDMGQRVSSPAGQLLASVFRDELGRPGLTKSGFCHTVGITPQYLNLMLAGAGNPSLVTLETMMRGLDRIVAFPRSSPAGEGTEPESGLRLPIVERLASLMREELESTRETQLELASRANVSRFYIKKTIQGLANPSLLSLEIMLKGIGRTIAFPKADAGVLPDNNSLEGHPASGNLHKRHAGGRPRRSKLKPSVDTAKGGS